MLVNIILKLRISYDQIAVQSSSVGRNQRDAVQAELAVDQAIY